MLVPNPDEVAVITVNGLQYNTWESVMVQHRWMEAFPIFQFEVAEPVPVPTSFSALRFFIGDMATVTLGGIQAIFGPITVRQSAEDGRTHGVQLVGKGLSWQMVKSSIFPTWNFDNQTIVQIAQAICGPVGVGVKTQGNVDMTPFPRLQAAPGEPSFDFLDQICRKRSTVIASDEFGNLVLAGQVASPEQAATLVEGYNIKRINCVWSNDTLFSSYFGVQQAWSDNSLWGTPAAQQFAGAGGPDPLTSNLVIPSELADYQSELVKRVNFEAQVHNGTRLKCTITVQGWKRPNGDLWRVGNGYIYTVDAPSHMLNGAQLCAQTVTFTQDEENGTLTTLELVLPQLINGPLFTDNPNPTSQPAAAQPFPQTPAATTGPTSGP